MARRQPVAFFLGDVGFLADKRFRQLARRLPDGSAFRDAVGTYWMTVAIARGNGSRTIDARLETESPYVDDLEAVGLLEPDGIPEGPWQSWGAQSPQQSLAGKARAESATRSSKGTFVPTSGTSALDKLDQRVQPSPPLPSIPLSTDVEGVLGGDDDPLDVYWQITGTFPSGTTKTWLLELAAEFGAKATGNAVAAEFPGGPRGTVLKRAQNRLRSEAEKAQKARAAKETQRMAEIKRSSGMTDEQAAKAREYLAQITANAKPMPGPFKPIGSKA